MLVVVVVEKGVVVGVVDEVMEWRGWRRVILVCDCGIIIIIELEETWWCWWWWWEEIRVVRVCHGFEKKSKKKNIKEKKRKRKKERYSSVVGWYWESGGNSSRAICGFTFYTDRESTRWLRELVDGWRRENVWEVKSSEQFSLLTHHFIWKKTPSLIIRI